MSIEDDIVGLLEDDETLADYLTGGIFVAEEISRQRTPGAFDTNGEILPCALVKSGTEVVLENVIAATQTPV